MAGKDGKPAFDLCRRQLTAVCESAAEITEYDRAAEREESAKLKDRVQSKLKNKPAKKRA